MATSRRHAMTLTQLPETRREILALSTRHGATDVRAFGSVVRGDATPDSDVDFLVTMKKRRSLLDLSGLTVNLHDLLGRNVDVVTENSVHWYIRDRVLKEAVPL